MRTSVAALAAMICLAGCSFVMMTSTALDETTAPRCESSRLVPAVDAAGALTASVVGSAMTLRLLAEDAGTLRVAGVASVTFASAAVLTWSSVVGFSRARRCERARRRWGARHAPL
jgi:hypothetical protein